MAELVGRRTSLRLRYPRDVDPDNIDRLAGPDLLGAVYQIVGTEGRFAYFAGAGIASPAPSLPTNR